MNFTSKQISGLKLKKIMTPIISGVLLIILIISIPWMLSWGSWYSSSSIFYDYISIFDNSFYNFKYSEMTQDNLNSFIDSYNYFESHQNIIETSVGKNIASMFFSEHGWIKNSIIADWTDEKFDRFIDDLNSLSYSFRFGGEAQIIMHNMSFSGMFSLVTVSILFIISLPDFAYIFKTEKSTKQFKILLNMEIVKLTFTVIWLAVASVSIISLEPFISIICSVTSIIIAICFITFESITVHKMKYIKEKPLVQNNLNVSEEISDESKNNFSKKYLPALQLSKIGALIWIIICSLGSLSMIITGFTYLFMGMISLGIILLLNSLLLLAIVLSGSIILINMINRAIRNQHVKSQVIMAIMCILFGTIFGVVGAIPILTAEQ